LVDNLISARAQEVARAPLDDVGLPVLRRAVDEALGPHVERLAALIARAHLEAGMGERMTYAPLHHSLRADQAPHYLGASRPRAVEALRKPLGGPQPGDGSPAPAAQP